MRWAGELIVSLIIGLIILGVLLAFYWRVYEFPIEEKEKTCRSTLEFKSKTVVNAQILEGIYNKRVSIAPAICESSEIDLGGKVEDRKVVKVDEIKKEFSKYMQKCWWQYAEGRYPYTVSLMVNKQEISLDTLKTRGDYIKKCYDISLPQIIDEQGNDVENVAIVDVINFMKDEENKREGYTPYDYVTKHNNRPGRLWFFEDRLEGFRTYSIYYSDPNWQDEKTDSGYNGIYLIDVNRKPQTFKVDWNAIVTQEQGLVAGGGCIVGSVIGGTVGAAIGGAASIFVAGVGAIPAAAAGAGYGCAVGGTVGLSWQTFDTLDMFFSECETGEDCPALVVD